MSMGNKLVYSTGSGGDQRQKASSSPGLPAAGPTKMRLESKGRGGKEVTVLFNLPFSPAEAEALMKTLQTRFGHDTETPSTTRPRQPRRPPQ